MLQTTIFSAMSWLAILFTASATPVRRSSSPSASSISTIHQFPNGTWIENLAIRTNGGILLSDFTSPELLYVDPFSLNPSVSTIHTFPSPATGLVGLAELETDIFYVVTLEYSFATFSATPGSAQVWRVDMSHYPSAAPVTLVASLPSSIQPNGVTALSSTKKILIADYVKGVIWRVDAKSGAVDVAANDPALASSGVNGIHAPGNGFLYFTNTGASTYGKLPIDSTGTETGSAVILFHDSTVAPDDFALFPQGGSDAAFLVDGTNNRVVYTTGKSNSYSTIANIQGPTAAAFGRRSGDTNSLYVASTGGDLDYAQNPVPVGGRVTRLVIKD